jgi:hypothetical protein
MEPAGSGATWTESPKGVFAGRKHHKPRQSLKNNGVSGTNDMAGKAVRATFECTGTVPRYNTAGVRERSEWSCGTSDIEGKTTRVGASEWSRRDASDIDGQTERSNGREHMSQCGQRTSFNRTREAGNRDEVEGVVANTLKLYRNGGVSFIVWLDRWRRIHHLRGTDRPLSSTESE